MSAALHITPIPAFEDNYIWAIDDGVHAAVIDPGEDEPVRSFLEEKGLRLAAILITHHHGDHTGGNAGLARDWSCPVYGPDRPAIPNLSHRLQGGIRVTLAAPALDFAVLDFAGHTRDHIGYFGHGALFCGDTLFSCGCGKLFEGTPAQMTAAMKRILSLPTDTGIYCAHEYTLENIPFARVVEPDNPAIDAWEEEARRLIAHGMPTIPTTLAQERSFNPFLRFDQPGVIAFARRYCGREPADDIEVFAAVREARDRWRG